MLITWVLIVTLFVMYVQNYSGHLPQHLDSPVKYVKRKTEGKKEKLTRSLQSSTVLNKETEKQRLLQPKIKLRQNTVKKSLFS